MAGDIFSGYIKNMMNSQNKGGKLEEKLPYMEKPFELQNNLYATVQPPVIQGGEAIDILKEISSKLDKINVAKETALCQPAPYASALPPFYHGGNADGITVDIAIENGLLVLPDNGVFSMSLYIKDGKIHSMGKNSAIKAKRTIDAQGKYVLPGIIDPHVHLGLFAALESELDSETKSAIIGGVTTTACYFGGQESHFKTFPQIAEQIERYAHTDVLPHLIIATKEQREEIRDYVNHFGITSFKIYMNGIPDLIPDVDDGFILDVLTELKRVGKPCILCAHAENRYVVRRAGINLKEEKGDYATVADWSESHPDMAEEEAVVRLSYWAEKMEVPVYLVHISSKIAIERLRKIKAENKYVHVETTSPYLTLTKHSTTSNNMKMEPPIRGQEDADALWQGVLDGTVDTIGTDNTTQSKAQKNGEGSIWDAIPGYSALETHLPSLLNEGLANRGIPMDKLIAPLTKRVAETFGIYPQKGSLLPNSDADIVIVDMDIVKEIHAENLSSRSDFSIFEGKKLRGFPMMTIKGGEIAAENGRYIETNVKARCLKGQKI